MIKEIRGYKYRTTTELEEALREYYCENPKVKAIYFEAGDEPEEVLYGRARRRVRRKKERDEKDN